MMLSSVQALRFIAALMVLLFHLGIMQYDFKGVDLFFVISGFVLYYNYNTRPATTRQLKRKYFTNRLTKIYLLYWTVLILLYIEKPYPFNLSFWGTFLLVPGHYPILSISWSLSCELYFYALLGISLFYIPARWQKGLFISVFIFSAGVKLFNTFCFSLRGTPLYFLAGPNLWEFLCGLLAGFAFCKMARPSHFTAPGLRYLFLSFLLLILFWVLPIPRSASYYHFIYGSIGLLLVASAALGEQKGNWKGPVKEWVIRLGNASYAIYLFGPVLVRTKIYSLSWKIATMVILIILSLVINRFYEEPLLRIVRGFLAAKKKPLRAVEGRSSDEDPHH